MLVPPGYPGGLIEWSVLISLSAIFIELTQLKAWPPQVVRGSANQSTRPIHGKDSPRVSNSIHPNLTQQTFPAVRPPKQLNRARSATGPPSTDRGMRAPVSYPSRKPPTVPACTFTASLFVFRVFRLLCVPSPVCHAEDVVLDAELRADIHHRFEPGNHRLAAWNGGGGVDQTRQYHR